MNASRYGLKSALRLALSVVALVAASACITSAPDAGNAQSSDATPDAEAEVGEPTDAGDLGDPFDAASDAAFDAASDMFDMGSDMSAPPDFKRTSAGRVLYYRFGGEGEQVIVDEAPGGRDIVLETGAVLSPQGLSLATGTFILVPDAAAIFQQLRTGPGFTVEFWVTTEDDLFAELTIFGLLRPAQVPARVASVDAPICIVACDTAPPQVRNALKRGEPTHVVLTGEDDTIRVYIDGVLAGAWIVDDVNDFLQAEDPADLKIELGSFSVARTYGLFAVYERALSPGEVLSHSFVGPRPEPQDEVNIELQALFPTHSDDGIFQMPALRRTILNGAPTMTEGEVVASVTQHGLYRQALDVPASGMHLYSALDLRTSLNQIVNEGDLEVWSLRRSWGPSVTWDSTGTEPWAAPGAVGPTDRGSDPIATFAVTSNDRITDSVPLEAWFSSIYDGSRTNHGFQFICDGCALEVASRPRSIRDFNRLRIKSLFEQARGSIEVVPPSGIEVSAEPENIYRLEWSGQEHGVEIYVNGMLVRQIWGAAQTTIFINRPAGTNVSIRSVDRWGRQSGLVGVVLPMM